MKYEFDLKQYVTQTDFNDQLLKLTAKLSHMSAP